MIAAGSGFSLNPDPVEAALEASLQAQERSGTEHADVCIVFVTAEAHPAAHALLHAVRRVSGAHAVIGCSGAGVLTERGEFEEAGGAGGAGAAVAVLSVATDAWRVTPFLVDETEGLGEAAGKVAGARVLGPARDGGVILVLADPMGLEPQGLLRGIAAAAGPLPVLGGVAAGEPLFELYNTEAASGTLAGLAVSGPPPVVGVAQGCEPIGEPFVITRGEGAVVQEIAGRRAVDVLQEALATVPDVATRIRRAGVFAGLAMDPAKSPLERGDFLVRNLLGVDRDSGAVGVAQSVRVGQTIQFHIRDASAAADDLDATLGRMATALGGRRPGFGLYFNCAGRGRGLFGVPDHDAKRIRERLGEFPLVGFFGNGEFAPVGARNFFHNYTGVLVVFAETGGRGTP